MKTSLQIKQQVPQFVLSDYPKFVEFLEKYYDFLEESLIRYETVRDIDEVTSEYIFFIKREFAKHFPSAVIDERKLIKYIHQMYQERGTVDGIKLLFRFFFGEVVKVDQPGKNILRTSDGIWLQDKFVTLELLSGDINDIVNPEGIIYTEYENTFGSWGFEITRIIQFDSITFRAYFKNITITNFIENQDVFIKNELGEEIAKCKLLLSPSKIIIDFPGKYWRRGQIFTIEGELKNTLCRVSMTDNEGLLKNVEILDHGYTHTINQSLQISPFPYKPETIDYSFTETPIESGGTAYSLTFGEITNEINEFVDGVKLNTYFLNDYVEDAYNGEYAFEESQNNYVEIPRFSGETTLIINEWYDSLTTLTYEHNTVSATRGYFYDNRGKLSSPDMCLQDNYFYQLFSYLVYTNQDISKYRSLIQMIHPAGLKFFAYKNIADTISYKEEYNEPVFNYTEVA